MANPYFYAFFGVLCSQRLYSLSTGYRPKYNSTSVSQYAYRRIGSTAFGKSWSKNASLKATLQHDARSQRHCGEHPPFFFRREKGEKGDARKECRVCKQNGVNVRVQMGCATCMVGLCFRKSHDDTEPSCFDLYHDETCDKIID